jgi:uncharacterized protein (DUF302 family)
MRRLSVVAVAFFLGVSAALFAVYLLLPRLLIQEAKSPYPFDETVETIIDNVKSEGHVVPKVYDFRQALIEHGNPDVGEVKVIEICYPEYAAELLSKADNKFVTPFMPCAVGVYTKDDGHTYVASLNVGLMSKLLGADVSDPMGKVADQDEKVLAFLHQVK